MDYISQPIYREFNMRNLEVIFLEPSAASCSLDAADGLWGEGWKYGAVYALAQQAEGKIIQCHDFASGLCRLSAMVERIKKAAIELNSEGESGVCW